MGKDRSSRTARKVALNVISLGSRRGMDEVLPAGIVDATATLLVKCEVASQREVDFSRSKMAVGIYLAFDWMMPGQFEAFAHRKAFCERQVREGIEAGAGQVLVLGAGFDTLCWRLAPEFGSVRFFEIDHPATSQVKRKGIEAMGRPANLHLIGEDLGERQLIEVLRAEAVWDSTAATVIVAEGLLMYLRGDSVGALFKQCAAVTGEGSRCAFSYIGTRTDGQPDAGRWTPLVLWILKVSNEPWLWSVCPEDLDRFLKENGWSASFETKTATEKRGIEFFGVAVE